MSARVTTFQYERCASCQSLIPAQSKAAWHPITKEYRCLECHEQRQRDIERERNKSNVHPLIGGILEKQLGVKL